jgi:hypothetical protein
MMFYAYALEKGTEFLIFSSPVRLKGKDFLVKETFNMVLKIMKSSKNIRFLFKEIDPSKLAIIINKAYIILVVPNGSTSWTPHI